MKRSSCRKEVVNIFPARPLKHCSMLIAWSCSGWQGHGSLRRTVFVSSVRLLCKNSWGRPQNAKAAAAPRTFRSLGECEKCRGREEDVGGKGLRTSKHHCLQRLRHPRPQPNQIRLGVIDEVPLVSCPALAKSLEVVALNTEPRQETFRPSAPWASGRADSQKGSGS